MSSIEKSTVVNWSGNISSILKQWNYQVMSLCIAWDLQAINYIHAWNDICFSFHDGFNYFLLSFQDLMLPEKQTYLLCSSAFRLITIRILLVKFCIWYLTCISEFHDGSCFDGFICDIVIQLWDDHCWLWECLCDWYDYVYTCRVDDLLGLYHWYDYVYTCRF